MKPFAPKNITRAILAIGALAAFLAVFAGLFAIGIPIANRDALMFSLGVLATILKDVYVRFFGDHAEIAPSAPAPKVSFSSSIDGSPK